MTKTFKFIPELLRQVRNQRLKYSGADRPTDTTEASHQIAKMLLEDESLAEAFLTEASVHLPKSGKIWVATFAGATGGQTWRTTQLTNKEEALALARKWEAEAAKQRAQLGAATKMRNIRLRRWPGGFTQREVAIILSMTERGVRAVERRALQKLFNNLELRDLWQKFLTGELNEADWSLSPTEAAALLDLTRTSEEYDVVKKLLCIAND